MGNGTCNENLYTNITNANTNTHSSANSVQKLPTISYRNSEDTTKKEGGMESEQDISRKVSVLDMEPIIHDDNKAAMIIVDEESSLNQEVVNLKFNDS